MIATYNRRGLGTLTPAQAQANLSVKEGSQPSWITGSYPNATWNSFDPFNASYGVYLPYNSDTLCPQNPTACSSYAAPNASVANQYSLMFAQAFPATQYAAQASAASGATTPAPHEEVATTAAQAQSLLDSWKNFGCPSAPALCELLYNGVNYTPGMTVPVPSTGANTVVVAAPTPAPVAVPQPLQANNPFTVTNAAAPIVVPGGVSADTGTVIPTLVLASPVAAPAPSVVSASVPSVSQSQKASVVQSVVAPLPSSVVPSGNTTNNAVSVKQPVTPITAPAPTASSNGTSILPTPMQAVVTAQQNAVNQTSVVNSSVPSVVSNSVPSVTSNQPPASTTNGATPTVGSTDLFPMFAFAGFSGTDVVLGLSVAAVILIMMSGGKH